MRAERRPPRPCASSRVGTRTSPRGDRGRPAHGGAARAWLCRRPKSFPSRFGCERGCPARQVRPEGCGTGWRTGEEAATRQDGDQAGGSPYPPKEDASGCGWLAASARARSRARPDAGLCCCGIDGREPCWWRATAVVAARICVVVDGERGMPNSNDRVAAQDGLRTRNEGADRQATYGSCPRRATGLPSRCHQASSAGIAGRLRGSGGEVATLGNDTDRSISPWASAWVKEWLVSQSEAQSVALVTGASGGLGKEVARQLAEQGVHAVIASRDPAATAKTAEELGVSALRVDSTSPTRACAPPRTSGERSRPPRRSHQ